MTSSGVGRPIYGNGPPSPPENFEATNDVRVDRLAKKLIGERVPGLRVMSSPGELIAYSRDQSEIPRFLKALSFRTVPDIVVQPQSAEAVSAAVRFASSRGLAVVPRGVGSSPFGGAVPVVGGMVVDMSRMDRVVSVDPERMVVTVEAGARWADVDQEVGRHGLRISTCPSSRFSTVGGWIATGGLGLNSFSRGHLSESVLSVEVVSPDGVVRRYTREDADFERVFGSEGQIGVVVSATLSVERRPEHHTPHLLLFDRIEEALSFADLLIEGGVRPAHIVFESSSKMALVAKELGGDRLRPAETLVVSIEGEESEAAFSHLLEQRGVAEEEEYLARYMWNERFFPMKVRRHGPGMLGTEVVAPRSGLPSMLRAATKVCTQMVLEPQFEVHFLQDGRVLLLCFYLVDQGNTFAYTLDAFKSLILARVLIDAGGEPYSLGVWNNPFSMSFDPSTREELGVLKSRLDPTDVMNTGKFFRLLGRWGGLGALVFSPQLMRAVLGAVMAFSPVSTSLIGRLSVVLREWFRPKWSDPVLRVADECAMCGSCVSVCPAYAVLGDERATARGKMQTAKAMATGATISKAHARTTFLCMRCKACEQVCQSKLELVPAFEELERRLERLHGRDGREIEQFIRFTEASDVYDDLIRKGLVVGAPRDGRGGEDDGV